MNVCIFFNRSNALWHALALDLKNRFGVKNLCAYVYGKRPHEFILSQKEINYHTFLTDDILAIEAEKEIVDDDWLKAKEKEYGTPFLWHDFTADRIMVNNWPRNFYPAYDPIFNHHQIKQQFQIRIKRIEKMMAEAKPDFIIMSGAGAMGVNLLSRIGKKFGCQTIVIETPRLGNKISLTSSLYGLFPHFEKKFLEALEGKYKIPEESLKEAEKWLDQFRNKPIKPFWSNPDEQMIRPVLFLKNLARNILNIFDNSFPKIYGYSVFDYLKRNFLILVNRHRFPEYDKFNPDEDYAFFPLHYEPELALSMYAPYYTDQLWLVKNIAQSLPINFKLCVKEHPAMLFLRRPGFYKELKKIPNVKLVSPSLDSIPIVKNSKIVIVVTSTAGWEGTFFKKPVISFGSILFNVLPGVKRCYAMEKLPFMIKDCLENFQHDEKQLINLVAISLEGSFDINLPKLWAERDYNKTYNNPDLKILANEIIKFHKSGDDKLN